MLFKHNSSVRISIAIIATEKMPRYQCAFCPENVSIKNMGLHLSINHSDVPNKYACGEENCSRKFDNIKSLKCHLHKKHNIDHKVYSFVVSPHENEVVPNQFEPATDIEIDDEPIESVPKKTAVEDQNDDLFKSLLKFALYLHSLPNMPRSIAVKIIGMVFNLIIIQYTMFVRVQLTNLTAKIELDIAQNIFLNMFASINTEHKFLNELSSKEITQKHLDNQAFHFSSSEMLCFINFLPLMIGDKIPQDDEVWDFFTGLLKILDIVMDSSVNEADLLYLDALVREHHRFYCRFFKATLKPKHHFMLHYSTVMRLVGPLKNLWCMRLEAKHKEIKKYATVISSRQNLALSLAIKEQLKLSNRFFSQTAINWNEIIYGPKIDASKFNAFHLPASTECFKWIEYNGIKYEPNLIIHSGQDNFNFLPVISKIVLCCTINGALHFLIRQDVQTIGYNEHYHCHIARKTENNNTTVISVNNVLSFPCSLHSLPDSADFGFCLRNF
jgi:hypothetical protein